MLFRSKSQPGFAESFLPWGRAPNVGELFKFPGAAAGLRAIAKTQGQAFYGGEIAQAIERFAAQNGGTIKASDFASFQPEWVKPIAKDYRGYTLHEIPPNGSGIAAQIALGILEAANVKQYPANSAKRIHLQVEAMRIAFADAYAYVADASSMSMPVSSLLNRDYLASRAALIDHNQAGTYGPGDPHSGGTV